MRLLLIALLVVAAPTFAAESATELARREAQQFLTPCASEPGRPRQLCLANQAAFVWDYVSAKSGEFDDQSNITFMFRHGDTSFGGGGILQSDLQACAWLLVIVTSGDPKVHIGYQDTARTSCSRVSEAERPLAAARAARISQDIRSKHARKLSGDSNDFYGLALKGQMTENTFPLGDAPQRRSR